MVKSAPAPSTAVKSRRRSNLNAPLLLLIVLLFCGIATFGAGFLAPARLALAQEQILGLLRGGIISSQEQTFVDGCVPNPAGDGPLAITRTTRTSQFRDGTSLSVTFSEPPVPTNMQCNG